MTLLSDNSEDPLQTARWMPVRTGNLYGNPLVAGIKVRLARDASMSAGVNVTEPEDNEWHVGVKFELGRVNPYTQKYEIKTN